jgi:hypothetical protein
MYNFVKRLVLWAEEMLDPPKTDKLEDHPLSVATAYSNMCRSTARVCTPPVPT